MKLENVNITYFPRTVCTCYSGFPGTPALADGTFPGKISYININIVASIVVQYMRAYTGIIIIHARAYYYSLLLP